MKRKQSASVRGRRNNTQHLEAFRLCCRCASASGTINAAYPSSDVRGGTTTVTCDFSPSLQTAVPLCGCLLSPVSHLQGAAGFGAIGLAVALQGTTSSAC